jgi:hypothetical protein
VISLRSLLPSQAQYKILSAFLEKLFGEQAT